jgi:predicted phage tail protein
MTKVILHGVLEKEFGSEFNFKLCKAKDVVRAIDANKKNFLKRVHDLARQGFNYTIVVDGKKISELKELEIVKDHKQIDLVPMIVGAGIEVVALGAFLLKSVGLTALAEITIVAGLVGAIALTGLSMGLQMLLAPKPDAGAPISATTKALSESFNFSNKVNLASQGSPVPVGFGRLKVGSQVVQFCIKSFPQTESTLSTMTTNPFSVLTYLDNATIISNRS